LRAFGSAYASIVRKQSGTNSSALALLLVELPWLPTFTAEVVPPE
jgi:hypothetical protein